MAKEWQMLSKSFIAHSHPINKTSQNALVILSVELRWVCFRMLINVIILVHHILKRRIKFLDINWLHIKCSSARWWVSIIIHNIYLWFYVVTLQINPQVTSSL